MGSAGCLQLLKMSGLPRWIYAYVCARAHTYTIMLCKSGVSILNKYLQGKQVTDSVQDHFLTLLRQFSFLGLDRHCA